jgi:hypothetical protein
MKYLKFLFGLCALTFCLSSCGQTNSDRTILGKEYAKNELTSTLKDSQAINLVNNKTVIIKDSSTAVAVAEPILFGIYGRQHIIEH